MLSKLTALASSSLHFQRGHLSVCTFLDKESAAIKTFGDKVCHPERSEGSGSPDEEILRCAQDDSQGTS